VGVLVLLLLMLIGVMGVFGVLVEEEGELGGVNKCTVICGTVIVAR